MESHDVVSSASFFMMSKRSAAVRGELKAIPATAPPTDAGSKQKPDRYSPDPTFTDRAYRELEERIVTLSLAPGAVLSEQGLSKELDIGRTPIREALQRLARDGLVIVLPRRGILVSPINLETQLKVLEVRRVVERLMAKLAAERASVDERQDFTEIAKGMLAAAKAADDRAFMRLDLRFNTLLSSASHNEFATRSMGLMHGLSRRFWYQHYKQTADLPLVAKLHARVAQAVSKSDGAGAANASDDLVDYIESFARKTLHFSF
jgi:DNA-binding GntR family transcriptional regulator